MDMKATISAGVTYYVESGSELVYGGTTTAETDADIINVTGKTYNVYIMDGKMVFIKVAEDC